MLTVREDQAGIKAYHRIIGKRTNFTCVLIYTSVKDILVVYGNGPETLLSVGVCVARMRLLP
jgi:hypothetical protein